jgi:carboxymethylenebutenolidase
MFKWFADKFLTVVPDLYRGEVATDHERAGHLMSGLDWPGAVQDIQGAANYLKSRGVEKIGVTGKMFIVLKNQKSKPGLMV